MAKFKHTKPLTDASVRNLKPGKKVIEVADHSSPGLRLRVSPFGVRTWFYRHRRPDGGLAKITLGRYPTMSLAAARVEWKRLSDTRDPKAAIEKEKAQQAEEDRKAKAEAMQDALTVRELVQQYTRYISTPGDGFLKSWKEVGRVLERNLVDLYGDLPAHELTRSAIKEIHKRLRAQGKPAAANRALSHIRACYNWAIEEDMLGADFVNPAARVKLTVEHARQVTLNDSELKVLFTNLPACGLNQQEQDALLFTLATGCRIGEVCGMARNELFPEIREWRIPEGRTKNGMQHSVYLSDLAMEILERQPQHTSMVWPNPSSETGALRRDTLGARLREALPKLKLSFRCHDLRRTMATWLGNEQVDDRVIDRILNHQPRTLSRVYNISKYDRPAHESWQAWGRHLQGLMTENVVPMKRTKRS